MLAWTFVYEGSKEDAVPALVPFDNLSPLGTPGEHTIPYKLVNDYASAALDSYSCMNNKTHVLGISGLQTYILTTNQAVLDIYSEKVQQHPEVGTAWSGSVSIPYTA